MRDVGRAESERRITPAICISTAGPAVGFGILALPSANALDVSRAGPGRAHPALAERSRPGRYYEIAFDSTEFVSESISEVIITLIFAIVLVVITIFLFLQDWRTTLIPAITIPVSLIGTFALMKVLGFSINTLTLFG